MACKTILPVTKKARKIFFGLFCKEILIQIKNLKLRESAVFQKYNTAHHQSL